MSVAWVAAAVAAVGALAAGNAQKNASEYQATVADQNAQLARRNASSQEEQQRIQARRFQGAQLAAIGESGAGLSGSTASIFRESLFNSEMDALNIRYEGEIGANSYSNSANASRYSGKVAQQQGYLSAASSLTGAAAKSYGKSTAPKTGALN